MTQKISLSVIVLTHNDEEHIVDCLELLSFADELIIVDDLSTDRTLELVKNYTDKIYTRPLNNNFSNQRNFALNIARSQWVLFIDSDEFVSDKLRDEILLKIKSKVISGYYLKRIDFMWGRKILHGEVGEIRLLRLARKDSGKWHGKVHEKWQVKNATETLIHPLIHSPHQTVKEFISEIDSYSTLRANELADEKIKANALTIIAYPVGKFIQNYFLRRGYKDGVAGFIYAMIMSLHSFMVRGKLYLGESNPE